MDDIIVTLDDLKHVSSTGVQRAKSAIGLLQYSEGLVRRNVELTRLQMEIKLRRLEARARAELKERVDTEKGHIEHVIDQMIDVMSRCDALGPDPPECDLLAFKYVLDTLSEQIERKRVIFQSNKQLADIIDESGPLGVITIQSANDDDSDRTHDQNDLHDTGHLYESDNEHESNDTIKDRKRMPNGVTEIPNEWLDVDPLSVLRALNKRYKKSNGENKRKNHSHVQVQIDMYEGDEINEINESDSDPGELKDESAKCKRASRRTRRSTRDSKADFETVNDLCEAQGHWDRVARANELWFGPGEGEREDKSPRHHRRSRSESPRTTRRCKADNVLDTRDNRRDTRADRRDDNILNDTTVIGNISSPSSKERVVETTVERDTCIQSDQSGKNVPNVPIEDICLSDDVNTVDNSVIAKSRNIKEHGKTDIETVKVNRNHSESNTMFKNNTCKQSIQKDSTTNEPSNKPLPNHCKSEVKPRSLVTNEDNNTTNYSVDKQNNSVRLKRKRDLSPSATSEAGPSNVVTENDTSIHDISVKNETILMVPGCTESETEIKNVRLGNAAELPNMNALSVPKLKPRRSLLQQQSYSSSPSGTGVLETHVSNTEDVGDNSKQFKQNLQHSYSRTSSGTGVSLTNDYSIISHLKSDHINVNNTEDVGYDSMQSKHNLLQQHSYSNNTSGTDVLLINDSSTKRSLKTDHRNVNSTDDGGDDDSKQSKQEGHTLEEQERTLLENTTITDSLLLPKDGTVKQHRGVSRIRQGRAKLPSFNEMLFDS